MSKSFLDFWFCVILSSNEYKRTKKIIYNYFKYKYGWRKQEVKNLDLKIKKKQKIISLKKSTTLSYIENQSVYVLVMWIYVI